MPDVLPGRPHRRSLQRRPPSRQINAAFKQAAEGPLKGILAYSDEPLVSADYRATRAPPSSTRCSTMVDGRQLVKVLAWYDNEWGYSCRVVDLVDYIVEVPLARPRVPARKSGSGSPRSTHEGDHRRRRRPGQAGAGAGRLQRPHEGRPDRRRPAHPRRAAHPPYAPRPGRPGRSSSPTSDGPRARSIPISAPRPWRRASASCWGRRSDRCRRWSVPRSRPRSSRLADGEVAMLENIRFDPGEEANDEAFVEKLARLADLYVNDAFGAAHRAHASTEGIAHHLSAVAGYLMASELEALGGVLENPRRPLVAIIGGAKISTKIGGRREPAQQGRHPLDRRRAWRAPSTAPLGKEVGKSLVEEEWVETAARAPRRPGRGAGRDQAPRRRRGRPRARRRSRRRTVVGWTAIPADQMVVDVGPGDLRRGSPRTAGPRGTVVWNGPLGIYEIEDFARGTRPGGRGPGRLLRHQRGGRGRPRRGAATRPASPTRSATSRPAAAPPSSTSRARSCPGSPHSREKVAL